MRIFLSPFFFTSDDSHSLCSTTALFEVGVLDYYSILSCKRGKVGRLSGLARSARVEARIWCDVNSYAGLRVKTAFRFSSSVGNMAA